jgi:Na+/H+-dicarboxylate symporter
MKLLFAITNIVSAVCGAIYVSEWYKKRKAKDKESLAEAVEEFAEKLSEDRS